MMEMRYTICQQATNRFRPSELTKHYPRCPLIECWNCKGFGHLAHNCRNRKKEKKGMAILQNKFEVLKSRVMQCGVKEKTIRRQEAAVVECFKYEEEGHKCRECPLWRKKKRVEEKPVHPVKGKVQETERKWRRAEEEKAAYVAKPQEA